MHVNDLIADLKRPIVSEPSRRILRRIFEAMGAELRFCRLEWCQRPFAPKLKIQEYCSSDCSEEDWNKNRRFGQ